MILNLPQYNHRIRETSSGREIFDPVRAKFVALTPEEWVRQNFMRYLIEEKKVPKNLMMVEFALKLYGMDRRADIVVCNMSGLPVLAVECKAASVKITQSTFDQLAGYNLKLGVPFLAVTNGLAHYYCTINTDKSGYDFIKELPDYELLKNF